MTEEQHGQLPLPPGEGWGEGRRLQLKHFLHQRLNLLLPFRLIQLRLRIQRRPLRMRPRLVQRLRQLALTPGLILRSSHLNRIHRRMPTLIQRQHQLPLTQRQQPQYPVIHRQFTLPFDLAEQATAITTRRLQRTPGNRPRQRRCAKGNPANQQIHPNAHRATANHSPRHPADETHTA